MQPGLDLHRCFFASVWFCFGFFFFGFFCSGTTQRDNEDASSPLFIVLHIIVVVGFLFFLMRLYL